MQVFRFPLRFGRRGSPVFAREELLRLTLRFTEAVSLDLQIRRAGRLFGFILQSADAHTTANHLAQWTELVEHDALLKERFQTSWVRMLTALDAVSLFAESGLPHHNALPAEVLRRLFERLLPSARHEHDAGRLFAHIFPSHRAVARFLHLPDPILSRLESVLSSSNSPLIKLRLSRDARQALCLLAARVAGRGASDAVRQRGSTQDIEQSPFYKLLFRTQSLVEALQIPGGDRDAAAIWNETVLACREELNQVHLHMEDAGVNSALVFDLRSIEATLDRMELLARFFAGDPKHAETDSSEAVHPGRHLLQALVRGRYEDTRLTYLFQQNLNLLARKTVERTGRGGEHSIAHTQAEYAAMWGAAAAGGLLTVFTAALKMRILEAHLPLFVEGLAISVDYSVSFVLLQIFGFALATKQPSMTAATLAGIVRDNHGLARNSKIAEFAADISRTQLAAAFGNILTVCVGAVAFEAVWARLFRTHYLPVASARHVYQTLHPFTSGTAVFAAFTGILLWIAAMIGGWFENFLVYHRISDAVRQHPLGHRVSPRTMQRAADWLERNIASWSTSIALGMLLGFAPVIARFFGIPLDVRHVTLSTGTLALAAARFGTSSFRYGWFYYAVAGIGVTFVLNLSVSFVIASIVALRAYEVPPGEQLRILLYVVKDFLQSPLSFVVPEKPDVLTIAQAQQHPGEDRG